MIRDITLGQFFPGESVLHRADPRMKLILSILFIAAVFMANTVLALAFITVLTFMLPLLGRIPLGTVMKSVKPLRFILVIMFLLFLLNGGGAGYHILWEAKLGFLHPVISVEGILRAVAISVRLVILVVATSVILSYTTSPIALADAIESLLKPLTYLHVPVHDFAMMITIAMRFIPILLEETDKIMSAQAARGADFKSGSLIRRGKALIPIFIPLFTSSVRHADNLATAMECRCYRSGEGRTCMKKLSYGVGDYLLLLLSGLILLSVIFLVHEGSGWEFLPTYLRFSYL